MEKPPWVQALEDNHGLPIDQIPGTIYALCYDPPFVVRSVSRDYAGSDPRHDDRGFLSRGPIAHYVGWTQQARPARRIANHHVRGTPVTVTIVGQGTMHDEDELKQTGICPTCGGCYADSLAT